MTVELPCEETGKPCVWQSEEWYGEDGELESWDNFCVDCGRWRDWSKDELSEDDQHVSSTRVLAIEDMNQEFRERYMKRMNVVEMTETIRMHLEAGLCAQGYVTKLTITYQSEGRFFANSPTKIPQAVWEEVIREKLGSGSWPMTVDVTPK